MFPSLSFFLGGGGGFQILVYYNLKLEAPSFLGRELGKHNPAFLLKGHKNISQIFYFMAFNHDSIRQKSDWAFEAIGREELGREIHSGIHWKFGLWWKVNLVLYIVLCSWEKTQLHHAAFKYFCFHPFAVALILMH